MGSSKPMMAAVIAGVVIIGGATAAAAAAAHEGPAGPAHLPAPVSVVEPGAVPAQEEPAAVPVPAQPGYSVNARGQSYGSEMQAQNPSEAPDLVLAMDSYTRGVEGYVLLSDLRGPQPTSLADAKRINELASHDRDIPLYASDGVTVIGKFRVSAGTSEGGTR